MTDRVLDELGYYLLAGAGGEGPATLMDEARRGEELGFGTGFISERWNVKEASSLTGAACAVTSRMQIATAATNHNTRHPLITGSWATTMHRLSGGRFTLGIGRGIGAIYSAFGIPAVTTAQMEDFAHVMRRLWRGEMIFNHDGPIGKYQILFLDPDFRGGHPAGPGGVRAEHPQTRRAGVRRRHPAHLFHPETLQRCVKTVRTPPSRPDRDPDSVRVWSCFATVGDHLPGGAAAEEDRRPAGHLPAGLRRSDGQDERLGSRCAGTVPGRHRRAVGRRRHRPQGHRRADRAHRHAHPRRMAGALGDRVGAAVRREDPQEFDYGADALIMHGASPDELEPIVAAYRATV